MTARQNIALLLIATWVAPDFCAARNRTPVPKNARLTWNELAPIVVDRKAKVKLSGGATVEGQVLAVRPESVVMDIAKSSDKHAWPKGQREVPRSSVAEFRLIKESGPGKLIGGILGTVGGFMTAGVMAVYTQSAAAILPGLLLVVPAMAVGGYYLGKAADIRTQRIRLLPETPALDAAGGDAGGGGDAASLL